MRQEVEANETEMEGAAPGSREQGQSIVLIVLVFVILLAFVGLAVDVGFAFARSSQFAAAVDAAALAGVQDMHLEEGDAGRVLAQARAEQFLNVNGWPVSEATSITSTRGTTGIGSATVSGIPEFTLTVTWPVEMFFLRLLNFDSIQITRSASAAFFAQSDMTTNTSLDRGQIRVASQFIFGSETCTSAGDPVSPEWRVPDEPNPTYHVTGGAYHYRIRIPANYVTNTLTTTVRVELFDPDTYNNPSYSTDTITHTNAYFAVTGILQSLKSCAEGLGQICMAATDEDTFFPTHNPYWYFRVDETYADEGGNCVAIPNGAPSGMKTIYSLFYYNEAGEKVALASYEANDGNGSGTDLKWVAPPGFDVNVTAIPLDDFGYYYIYLDVSADGGSSKNVWDLRAGPIYNSLPANVNYRNVVIANNPTITYTADLNVFVVGRMPIQHFTTGSAMIPLAPIDVIQGGGVIYASIFDLQGASAPISFTIDTLGVFDFSPVASIVASNPDPDSFQSTCSDGVTCDNVWMDPQWRIGIPGEEVAFFGGTLEATYASAGRDAHTWYMAITAGRPILTR